MNDIYEHKAKKYKYKYLKLKDELEGGMFNNKEKKEKIVKILDKVILDVKNFITPVFNKDKFLGLTYSEKGYVNDKSIKMEGINIKDRGREINKKNIYDYMLSISAKKKDKYPKFLHNLFEVSDIYFNENIYPIVRTLDIYLIIMFIKELFYYRVYSIFDNDTINLVQKLENDAYENNIGSPDLLIEKIEEIIKSINDSIPTTPTKK
jgi:hypothetical protein